MPALAEDFFQTVFPESETNLSNDILYRKVIVVMWDVDSQKGDWQYSNRWQGLTKPEKVQNH